MRASISWIKKERKKYPQDWLLAASGGVVRWAGAVRSGAVQPVVPGRGAGQSGGCCVAQVTLAQTGRPPVITAAAAAAAHHRWKHVLKFNQQKLEIHEYIHQLFYARMCQLFELRKFQLFLSLFFAWISNHRHIGEKKEKPGPVNTKGINFSQRYDTWPSPSSLRR